MKLGALEGDLFMRLGAAGSVPPRGAWRGVELE